MAERLKKTLKIQWIIENPLLFSNYTAFNRCTINRLQDERIFLQIKTDRETEQEYPKTAEISCFRVTKTRQKTGRVSEASGSRIGL